MMKLILHGLRSPLLRPGVIPSHQMNNGNSGPKLLKRALMAFCQNNLMANFSDININVGVFNAQPH